MSIFLSVAGSCYPRIATTSRPYMCKASPYMYKPFLCKCQWSTPTAVPLLHIVALSLLRPSTLLEFKDFESLSMHILQLNRECLLHLYSFLDKDSRRNLSLTCHHLREVFLEPSLWCLLHFHSPGELKKDNFVLGPFLHHLSISWHSSRVKVCNIEDWMKTSFQREMCRKHERLVSSFLDRVCNTCPKLISLTLSGCGHIMDNDVVSILRSCTTLRSLRLENCVRITDSVLHAIVSYGQTLKTVQVDFCRNVTLEGLQMVELQRPLLQITAERSAGMIPDCPLPIKHPANRQTLTGVRQKILSFS